MAKSSEAIIYIPGLEKLEKDQALGRLVYGIEHCQEVATVSSKASVALAGLNGERINLRFHEGQEKSIDVFEAYWGDLVHFIDHDEPLKKIWNSTSLLFYWLFSGIWSSLKNSKFLTLNIIGSALLLIAWYYGILVIGLVALGESQSLFGFTIDPAIMEKIGGLGQLLGGASIWLTSTVIMGFFPVNYVVRIAQFTKTYLQEELLRSKIRKRFAKVLQQCIDDEAYTKIIVVSHSFGSVVATDLLADFTRDPSPKELRLITMGSPVSFLTFRSSWLKEEFKKFASNPIIKQWTNLYSDGDWLGSPPPAGTKNNFKEIKMTDSSGFLDKLTGKTHNLYFERAEAMEELIG